MIFPYLEFFFVFFKVFHDISSPWAPWPNSGLHKDAVLPVEEFSHYKDKTVSCPSHIVPTPEKMVLTLKRGPVQTK